jgi:hypothetical protein
MLDGSNATPVIRDFTLGAAAAHLVGDLMLVQSDGYIDAVTGTTTEVTCVMQEAFSSGEVTAGTTLGKAAIITRNQVWRCSSDASTATTALIGTSKKIDTVDKNTIDASDITNGAMILVSKDTTDDAGNLIFYVVFADTTFGNT